MKTSKVKPPQKRSSSHMAAASRGGNTLVPRFVTCHRENATRIANAAFYGINFWTLLLDCQKCYLFLQGLARCKGHKSPVLYLYFCWPGHVSSQVSGIGIGDKLFRYSDFFSEKNYCGAPGGPISAILATITLDPLYFEVHIFSDPLDPPYMSKNAKMCYFEHFFGVRWKKPPQSRGPP